MWNKDNIDKLQINFREADADHIGIHAHKLGHTCRYFEIPLAWADQPGLFTAIYERLKVEWQKPDVLDAPCPVCGNPLHNFERRWKGFRFCGFCGTHYERRERDGGKNVVILRRMDEA